MIRLPVPLYIHHLRQDDPAKCTASKLLRFHLAAVIRPGKIPFQAVVLNPLAEKILLGHEDVAAGLVVIDCSWKRAEPVLRRRWRGQNRRLPLLLAANPINYGHLATLSSAEALAAALYITGHQAQAEGVLHLFKWGPTFLTLNKEPLSEYRQARSQDVARRLEHEYFPQPSA